MGKKINVERQNNKGEAMTAIWKFTLNSTRYVFDIPKGAKVLSVAVQYGEVCLWMEVDKTQPVEEREFFVAATGDDLPDGEKAFIGTVLTNSGATVFHVFEALKQATKVPASSEELVPSGGYKCLECGRHTDELSEDVFWVGNGYVHINCTDSMGDSLSREQRISGAIELAMRFGGMDEVHHKSWVIDQMVRVLAGSEYMELIRECKSGEDGPNTYEWDEGIAP